MTHKLLVSFSSFHLLSPHFNPEDSENLIKIYSPLQIRLLKLSKHFWIDPDLVKYEF